MPHDPGDPWSWVEKAEHDRSAAGRLFTPGCLELGIIAFLCQQAVEKLLKAYLVQSKLEPERIHDLGELALQCADCDAGMAFLAPLAAPLTAYAVIHRYPGPAEPTREQVRAAMEVVERVREEVLRRLPPERA